MEYPATPIRPVVEMMHGHEITDNYRWLENNDSAEVASWSDAQNSIVSNKLMADPNYQQYVAQLRDIMATDAESVPSMRHGRYFYMTQQANQDHSVAMYKDGLDGEPHVIINPNEIGATLGKSVSIHFLKGSPQGKYVTYGLMISGQEMSDLIVLELATMKEIARLPYHRGSGLWLPDESGFYHSQFPAPGSVPKGEEYYHMRVYFYLLHQSTGPGELIFGNAAHKEMSFGYSLSPDGTWITMSASRGWKRNDLYIARVGEHDFKPLVTGVDAKTSAIMLRDKILIVTNFEAENRKVLFAPYDNLPSALADWAELIPESTDNLSGLSATKDQLVLQYLHNATSRLYLYSHDGKKLSELQLPPLSSVLNTSTHRDEKQFFYSFGNFLASSTIYRYNPVTKLSEIYREPKRSLDPAEFIASQEWFKSTDGVKVPMFIIKRNDVSHDSSNKTLLYGYGGFGSTLTPAYPSLWIPFVQAGGVYVVANIRGGGEFGKAWHEGGVRQDKQQSYDDFIAAAKHLIATKVTSPARLAIAGGSNGGLLVAACLTQRPDLFAAVVCKVPLIDMVRFPQFLMASRWTEEYGDPQQAADLARILKWSPYQNVEAGHAYPATLITTGTNDSRVAPMHARKFAAVLQAVASQSKLKDHPVYLWTDKDKGHGPGQGRNQFASAQAMVLTFLDQELA